MDGSAPVTQVDWSMTDLVSGGICVLTLVALMVGLYIWLPKIASFGQEVGASEERFAQETIREFTGGAPPDELPPAPAPIVADLPPPLPSPALPPPLPVESPPPLPAQPPPFQPSAMPASAPALGVAEAEALQRLAERLTQLGIVESFEGRVPLAIPPTGLIYRLKRGGSCALLPRMEHPDTMEHMARRFDMVFVLQGAENVLVVERLASRAKDFLQMGPGQHG